MYKLKRIIKLINIILITAIICLCCGCSGSSSKAYIYFELPEKPQTLDPQTASLNSELLIARNIFEGLLRKDSGGKIVCGAAESYEKNGLTYSFKIREDAVWSNGEDVTADDFVFGIGRAVDPATESPFAYRLFCIKNAEKINSGFADINSLGIKAVDEKTVEIELEYEDTDFEESLTSPVAMPCNRDFFESAVGKYGLTREYIISNGSYRLTKWNKEEFGIRIYKNEEYNGNFKAKNAAVFLTCNTEEESVLSMLKNNKIDAAFLKGNEITEASDSGFKTVLYENICWFLTISDEIPLEMRKSFSMLINPEIFKENEIYSIADSIYPSDIISENDIITGCINGYSFSEGKALFESGLSHLENNKFPSSTTLKYENSGDVKTVLTALAGHWQKHLGAYINIEAQDNTDELISQLNEQSLPFSFFPVTAKGGSAEEYVRYFSESFSADNLALVQQTILQDYNIIPVMFEKTAIGYNEYLTEIYTDSGNGYIDFSFVIKNE